MQTRQLTLFVDGYFTSAWDASCFVALSEKQLEFTTARALLRDGQGAPAQLREQTPIARIPALRHGDFWLTESLAIVEYLEDAFPPPDYARLLPADPQVRARARQIMAWLRFDMQAMRTERPWQFSIYRDDSLSPLSPEAERDARELIDLVVRLSSTGELDDWNIAHADLTIALGRPLRLSTATDRAGAGRSQCRARLGPRVHRASASTEPAAARPCPVDCLAAALVDRDLGGGDCLRHRPAARHLREFGLLRLPPSVGVHGHVLWQAANDHRSNPPGCSHCPGELRARRWPRSASRR